MRVRRVVLFLAFFSAAVCWAQTDSGDNTRSLGDVARETRALREQNAKHAQATELTGNTQAPEATGQARKKDVKAIVAEFSQDNFVNNNEVVYQWHIRELFKKRDFAGLEKAAEDARSTQSRFPGGPWKLYFFYEAVTTPYASYGGAGLTQAGWDMYIGMLKHWAELYPKSVTARIALAQMYLDEGTQARGGDYADEVTEEGWQKLAGGTAQAEAALKEAAALPDKCPYYYVTMLNVALYSGWNKARTRALFEEAVKFEPAFYHYYRLYANYLQPKWYGQPGEMEAFATEIADRIGGDEGNFVYFEISTLAGCGPCGTLDIVQNMSWPRIKDGYAALQRLYGTSKLKMNRFAFLSTAAHDQTAAKAVFTELGENWDQNLWGEDHEKFEAARKWALAGSR